MPQPPQLKSSLSVITQPPLQSIVPCGHSEAHWWNAHTDPPMHTCSGPQPPQAAGFEAKSTQKPLQTAGAIMGHVQTPPEQILLPVQTIPHEPQFVGLFCVSTHAAPQGSWPRPHIA
jgi:hypothetical protein